MSKPNFVVHAADLERGTRSLTWVLPEAWLKSVLADSTATAVGDGKLEAELSKNGNEVMVRGHAEVSVDIPCVVTLEPLRFELKPEIFLLLAADPAARPPRPPKVPRPGSEEAPAKAKPARAAKPRPPKGKAGWTEDPELSGNEAARDTFDGERVVLDDFVREFILLELPMYPRRSDLPSTETPAIGAPSSAAEASPATVDPRLLPLAHIASRLREQQKKE